MQFKIPTLATILAIASLAQASPCQTKGPLPLELIYQFPLQTWIENVAARSNGELLLTLIDTPSLYSINPNTKNRTPKLIHSFPGVTSLFGIIETTPDVFVIAAGNYSNGVPVTGSFSVWQADFNPRHPSQPSPRISKIVDMPEAQLLNGVEYLPRKQPYVLIADSALGVIWKVNTATRSYSIAAQIPELLPPPNSSLNIGVNGIHIHDGYLYWTNSELQTLSRSKIKPNHDSVKGILEGKVDNIAHFTTLVDDFAIDRAGTVWVTTDVGNTLLAVGKDGKIVTVAGSIGEFTVAGDTGAVFGRARGDREILYVVTNGGLPSPVNGTFVEGGKIVAVDTKEWAF